MDGKGNRFLHYFYAGNSGPRLDLQVKLSRTTSEENMTCVMGQNTFSGMG